MKVRIISYEDINSWILGKFALKLRDELIKLGIEADISDKPDPHADINHHIIYIEYDGKKNNLDTLMVTHIDTIQKMNQLRQQMKSAKMAICMSAESRMQLINAGIPSSKVCYVNPCHDNVMKPRPIKIGVCTRVYSDGRKRENMLEVVANSFEKDDFSFNIMGSGWEKQVDLLKSRGYEVCYYPDFVYDEYVKFIPELDYYLYTGLDEGQMGFVDAVSAGVKTIVPPIGFHLDVERGITHPFVTVEELIGVLRKIIEDRKKLVNHVSLWTWEDYAKKHLEIWLYLLTGIKKSDSIYTDGSNSIVIRESAPSLPTVISEYKKLLSSPVAKKQRIRHIVYAFAPFTIVKIYKKLKKSIKV